MPTTPDKPKQFAFILSEDEHRMLGELAEADGRSAANWLRAVIREKFKVLKGGMNPQLARAVLQAAAEGALMAPRPRSVAKRKAGR